MAPSMIRKAIRAVKDQTSIGIAKFASNMAPDLEVAIVKATSHEDEPAGEKYIREIIQMTSYSQGYVHACVLAVSKRLGKTRDRIVALKALMLVHRLMSDGDPVFQDEILYATRKGTRLLNLSDFRDEAHSSSWDHSAFVRNFAMYLDQRLDLMLFERKSGAGATPARDQGSNFRDSGGSGTFRSLPPRPNYEYEHGGEAREFENGRGIRRSRSYDNDYGRGMRRSRSFGDVSESGKLETRVVTPLREMKPERIFGKVGHLQRLLNWFLSIRPMGLAKNSRMILV